MLLTAMLVDALHAALEDRIEAFNRVGGDDGAGFTIGEAHNVRVADVFFFPVVHGIMAGEISANFHVVPRLISHQAAFLADVVPQDRRNVSDRGAVDMEATGRAAALDKG